MKSYFIAFLMLVAVMAQAQVVSTREHYDIGNIGVMQIVEIKVAVEKVNDEVTKYCILEHRTQKGELMGIKITEDELETLLRKMDEIKVGNMNLNCDYFEKKYTIYHDINHELTVGYFLKTKLDANKGQEWFLRIEDGIYEMRAFPTFNDIYKTLGKARAKLQTL